MNIFKEIFARIWALWAALIFVVSMLIFLIPFLLFCYPQKDPVRVIRFVKYARVWMNIYFFFIGCRLTVKGKENFGKNSNYIVLCNHNSFMDIPVSSPAIPGGNKTIAKTEMARIPVFGLLYRSGSVLVDRKSEASRKESFNKMKEVLAMGLHMCIYPEGTRNKTDEPLRPFHSGAFRLSIETGRPIIPALIFHTRKVLPANKIFYAWPHRMAIHFLPAVIPSETDNAAGLRERVFEIMKNYYIANERLA